MQMGRETSSSPQPPPVPGIQLQEGPANSTALSADLSSLLSVFELSFCREEGRKILVA